MASDDQIGQAWTAHRAYLIDLAFRMLGDIGAAEDVVQEAFFRLVQTPLGGVDDARGWLIVVTSDPTCQVVTGSDSNRWPWPGRTTDDRQTNRRAGARLRTLQMAAFPARKAQRTRRHQACAVTQ